MRYKATLNGLVPFTDEENAEWDALEAAEAAGADTRAAEEVREKRNGLLAETDYFALSDVTLTDAMATYRQALRDLPTHTNFPNLTDDDWPVKPTGGA